jgi:hypothetical protein
MVGIAHVNAVQCKREFGSIESTKFDGVTEPVGVLYE